MTENDPIHQQETRQRRERSASTGAYPSGSYLRACHCCGLVHVVVPLAKGQQAECVRCFSTLDSAGRSGQKSSARCFASAFGGLLLYLPAILLPVLEIEKLGHHRTVSILGGTLDLIWQGNLFVGLVVFVFSIVLPLLKLLALLELSHIGLTHQRHRAWTYRLVEWTGRWSMMDVLLLALLVTFVKLGDLVSFQIGPAVIAFVLCVLMSMIASITFDPHAIWEESAPSTLPSFSQPLSLSAAMTVEKDASERGVTA